MMRWAAAVLVALAALRAPAQAQAGRAAPSPAPTDVEVPQVVIEPQADTQGPGNDEALDLANIVQSAAKGVTTVQEAPAIVTVITADEIRDRQFQDLSQLAYTVPGWQRATISPACLSDDGLGGFSESARRGVLCRLLLLRLWKTEP